MRDAVCIAIIYNLMWDCMKLVDEAHGNMYTANEQGELPFFKKKKKSRD